LGQRDETQRWLDRAEARFRHVVNPAPLFAAISYLRIALHYDKGSYQDVIELTPSLIGSFNILGMGRDEAKARLLRAAALKLIGRTEEAMGELELLRGFREVEEDFSLGGRILVEIGDIHQLEGRITDALASFERASALLQQVQPTGALGDLKSDIAALLRGQNRLQDAITAYRSALQVYESLGMATRVAYMRVLVAEILISANRSREAEWEILAALPTIEEQKMVPEGYAAVALLKESVRQRKTDPNALRELREHLQAANQK